MYRAAGFCLVFFLLIPLGFALEDSPIVNAISAPEAARLGDAIRVRVELQNLHAEDGRRLFISCGLDGERLSTLRTVEERLIPPGGAIAASCTVLDEVKEGLPPGTYTLVVDVLGEDGAVFEHVEKSIEVTGTKRHCYLDIQVRTAPCNKPDAAIAIHRPGQDVCATLSRPLATGEIVDMTLTAPDASRETLTLDQEGKAPIDSETQGTHTITADFGKTEECLPHTATHTFVVSDKKPTIVNHRVCRVDGSCDGDETPKNCPQDCLNVNTDPTTTTTITSLSQPIAGRFANQQTKKTGHAGLIAMTTLLSLLLVAVYVNRETRKII